MPASAQGETLFAAAGPDGRPVGQAVWGDLSDPVMGGVSESMFIIDSTGGEDRGPTGLFRGTVSTSNNGGFCNVRTRNFSPPVDASAYDAMALCVKGDGQRYKLFVRTEPGWDAKAYALSFDTKAGEWQTVTLPFKDFKVRPRTTAIHQATPGGGTWTERLGTLRVSASPVCDRDVGGFPSPGAVRRGDPRL